MSKITEAERLRAANLRALLGELDKFEQAVEELNANFYEVTMEDEELYTIEELINCMRHDVRTEVVGHDMAAMREHKARTG